MVRKSLFREPTKDSVAVAFWPHRAETGRAGDVRPWNLAGRGACGPIPKLRVPGICRAAPGKDRTPFRFARNFSGGDPSQPVVEPVRRDRRQ